MESLLRKSIKFLLFLTPFIALIVPGFLFFPFITGKAFAFRIIIELALGLYVASAIAIPEYRPKRSLLLICLTIFTGVIFLADIFSLNPFKAFWSNFERMEGFVTLAHLFAYFVILSSVFKSKRDWNAFLYTTLGVSLFLSLYGVLQLSGEITINQGGVRVDGTLGNATYYAVYLLFHIFILLFLWHRNKSNPTGIVLASAGGLTLFSLYYVWHINTLGIDAETFGSRLAIGAFILAGILIYIRYFFQNVKVKFYTFHFLYPIILLLEITLLYYTATRGAILGFIGGVFLASIHTAFVVKEHTRLRKVSFGVIAATVLLVAIFFGVKNLPSIQNDPVLGRFANISWNETKTQARSYVWPMAFEGFKEKPILGWGQEGFVYVFNKYYNPKMWSHEMWFDRTHNSFLDWLIAGGIFGFLGYISLFASSLFLIFRKSNFDVVEKALLLGLISGYAFHNLFVFDNLVSYILFFSLLAMVHSSSKESGEIIDKKAVKDVDKNNLSTLAAICIGLSLLVIYFVNIRAFFQNTSLIKALSVMGVREGNYYSCLQTKLEKQNGKSVNVCSESAPTLEVFKKSLSYNTFGTSEVREHMMNISVSMNRNKEVPMNIKQDFAREVIGQLEMQIKETPLEARAHLIMGTYLAGIGALNEGIVYLENALKLIPDKQYIMLQLGVAYLETNQKDKAYEIIKRAYEISPGYEDAAVIYIASSFSLGKKAEAYVAVDELGALGLADERVVKILSDEKDSKKAIEYLMKVIEVNPYEEKTYMILSSFYLSFNDKVSAINTVNLMIKNNPDNLSIREKSETYIQNINSSSTNTN